MNKQILKSTDSDCLYNNKIFKVSIANKTLLKQYSKININLALVNKIKNYLVI